MDRCSAGGSRATGPAAGMDSPAGERGWIGTRCRRQRGTSRCARRLTSVLTGVPRSGRARWPAEGIPVRVAECDTPETLRTPVKRVARASGVGREPEARQRLLEAAGLTAGAGGSLRRVPRRCGDAAAFLGRGGLVLLGSTPRPGTPWPGVTGCWRRSSRRGGLSGGPGHGARGGVRARRRGRDECHGGGVRAPAARAGSFRGMSLAVAARGPGGTGGRAFRRELRCAAGVASRLARGIPVGGGARGIARPRDAGQPWLLACSKRRRPGGRAGARSCPRLRNRRGGGVTTPEEPALAARPGAGGPGAGRSGAARFLTARTGGPSRARRGSSHRSWAGCR